MATVPVAGDDAPVMRMWMFIELPVLITALLWTVPVICIVAVDPLFCFSASTSALVGTAFIVDVAIVSYGTGDSLYPVALLDAFINTISVIPEDVIVIVLVDVAIVSPLAVIAGTTWTPPVDVAYVTYNPHLAVAASLTKNIPL